VAAQFPGSDSGPRSRPEEYPPSSRPPTPPQQQPYTPPSQRPQPAQPEYTPPQQQYPQPQPEYGQEYAPPPQADYGYAAPQAPPGYDYDPYAVREEEGTSTLRWVLIGCAVLFVFCCCSTIIALVIIDTLKLWNDIPIIKDMVPLFEDIAKALGFI
jgi:hypothetical protein